MKRKFSQKVGLKFFYAIGTKSCLAFARYENDAFQPWPYFGQIRTLDISSFELPETWSNQCIRRIYCKKKR